MKGFFYNLGCTVIIGFILYFGLMYKVELKEEVDMTYNMKPFIIFSTIFPIMIGMLLRLPKLFLEIKERKHWTFSWTKVIPIGIPALYIAVLPSLVLTPLGLKFLFAKELIFLDNSSVLTTTAGIVFGYVLLDSLKR
ncbi:MAG: hypothetical protein ACO1OT_19270 [Heyndrickxia sp.]